VYWNNIYDNIKTIHKKSFISLPYTYNTGFVNCECRAALCLAFRELLLSTSSNVIGKSIMICNCPLSERCWYIKLRNNKVCNCNHNWSQDGVVNIPTRQWTSQWGSRQGQGIFLFSKMSRWVLGATHPPIQWVLALFPQGA
jgi:hypothetical protein